MVLPPIGSALQSIAIPAVIVGVAILSVVALIVGLIVRLVEQRRTHQHLERMKALELGRDPEILQNKPPAPSHELEFRFWIAFWLGAFLPFALFGTATWLTTLDRPVGFGLLLTVWIGAAVMGLAGIVCSFLLMLLGRKER